MTKKNYLIAIEKDAISNITGAQIIKLMRDCKAGEFHLDEQKTASINEACSNMFEGTSFFVFTTDSVELYKANVHVRETDGRIEVFNITSDDVEHAQLSKNQMEEIIDAFKKFIGVSVVPMIGITIGDLLK